MGREGRWSEVELDKTWRNRGPVNSIGSVSALIRGVAGGVMAVGVGGEVAHLLLQTRTLRESVFSLLSACVPHHKSVD